MYIFQNVDTSWKIHDLFHYISINYYQVKISLEQFISHRGMSKQKLLVIESS